MARRWVSVVAVCATAIGLGMAAAGVDGIAGARTTLTAAGCPVGSSPLTADADTGAARGGDHPAAEADHPAAEADHPATDDKPVCWNDAASRPESAQDLMTAGAGTVSQTGLSGPTSLAAAVDASGGLANSGIVNSAGTWKQIGSGYQDNTNTAYPYSGSGLTLQSGRLSSYAQGPTATTVYASAANGGVWESTDAGKNWTSIGENLPTQDIASVAWSTANNGTLFALTGDNSFGRYNWFGLGMYYSNDNGATWQHSSGIPDGALGFKIAVNPDNASIMYAATGAGLYRSSDGGHTFTNVLLPTTPDPTSANPNTGASYCAANPFVEQCALASVITDVVVEGTDSFGHQGGAVVAVAGWRGGQATNADGTVQAPNNGIYRSTDGAVGSFAKIPDSAGFAPTTNVGRTSLGDAYGPAQNHDFLYAMVQDSQLLDQGGLDYGQAQAINDVNDALDLVGLGGTVAPKIPTYLNGVYLSKDFGKTWQRLSDNTEFLNPASGSAIEPTSAIGYGPGVQSWYNNWIQPDPYDQVPATGAPTRVDLGLEEVWEDANPTTGVVAATGTASTPMFHVVAPYAGLTYGCLLAGTPCAVAASAGVTSAHPDHHGVLFLPGADGARSALFTSDGGNYTAPVPLPGVPFKQTDFTASPYGFNTLLPYGFGVSSDGTVVQGLQDNGVDKIVQGKGAGIDVGPGDGGSSVIDPNNPNVFIEGEASGGALDLATTGGTGTTVLGAATDVKPNVGASSAGTQYVYPQIRMDYAPGQTGIIYTGREVAINNHPLAEVSSGAGNLTDPGWYAGLFTGGNPGDNWTYPYDLGTRNHPGDKTVAASASDPANVGTGVDLYNGTAYVGFCSFPCETLTSKSTFSRGLATNAGGSWHIAAASGLPSRLINTVLVDHNDPTGMTVYAGLGTSTGRSAFHPGLTGADGVDPNGGYLYKSTDGGQTFTDITGSLPKLGVLSLSEYGGQLIVGTALGAFVGSDNWGTSYGRLGGNLPAVPVDQIMFRPGAANTTAGGVPNQLYVSTYGRGIYEYTMPSDPIAQQPKPASIAIAFSATPLPVGRNSTVTVTVTPTQAALGTLTVKVNGAGLNTTKTVTLTAAMRGVYSLTVHPTTAGTVTVTASFGGSSQAGASTTTRSVAAK